MRPKAYSQALGMIASVLFGTAFREFDSLYGHLWAHVQQASVPDFFRTLLTGAACLGFYALFFRNIHGLFSYDCWIEGHHVTQLSLNRLARLVGVITPPLATLVGPFLVIDKIAKAKLGVPGTDQHSQSEILGAFALMFGAYAAWDVVLWIQIQPTERDSAALHYTVTNWLRCDGFGLLGFVLVMTSLSYYEIHKLSIPILLVVMLFTCFSYLVVGFDYFKNYQYYFEPGDHHG